MTRKWILIQPDGESSVLPVEADEEPDLATLQEAVDGFIEYAPRFHLQGDISIGFVDTDLFGNEISMSGKVRNVIMNEESRLPYYALENDEDRAAYVKEHLNPISQIFNPHDMTLGFVLGNAVVELEVRDEEQDNGCLDCENLPADHPDWMKGMCEHCYAAWAEAWNTKEQGE
jgi:hypothetical protein